MCGISGIVSCSPIEETELLSKMNHSLKHRGPDDSGEWWSENRNVGLAHRRLSIIDPTPGGHQPMTDSTNRFCITYNGELYNFRELRKELQCSSVNFRTQCDTEVILNAYRQWGVEFLKRLDGMFAFVIYDKKKDQIFGARDRCGEKPLFFHYVPGRFQFSSEMKALLLDPKVPREIDYSALEYYFTYGYVPEPASMIRSIRKVPPATFFTYDISNDSLQFERYWELPQTCSNRCDDGQILLEELEEILTRSIDRRLISDVPIGILLSGGVDSSLLTALAAKSRTDKIKTFTVRFTGHGRFDEGPYARVVAEHFGTEHNEIEAVPATIDLLADLAKQFDDPIADSSMIPSYLVCTMVKKYATVVLGGDGGDELFGGYPHYAWLQKLALWRKILPSPLRSAAERISRKLPVGTRGRNHLIAQSGENPNSLAHVNLLFDRWTRRELFSAHLAEKRKGITPEQKKVGRLTGNSILQEAIQSDFHNYLTSDILVKSDRTSMLASLEMRAPFLDHNLIEFAFSRVPDEMKATKSEKKILLRQLARLHLPSNLNLNRKQGFSVPLNVWLRNSWRGFALDVISQTNPRLFNRAFLLKLLLSQQMGFANAQRLFAVIMFELWRREYQVSF